MPALKEEKREQIIEAAKELFKERGFRGTTIRDIASRANLKHSNIRNYFKKKGEILEAIVGETWQSIKNMQNFHKEIDILSPSDAIDFSETKRKEYIKIYADFIDSHRDELFLLLFKMEGSSYEDVREEFVSAQQSINVSIFSNSENVEKDVQKIIKPFIFHNLAHMTLMVTGEFIKHNIPKEEIAEYANDFYIIGEAGLEKLLKGSK